MSISEKIERALAELIRGAEIGGDTIIRCWHAVKDDYRWRPDNDLNFPCIDIRAGGLSMATAYSATSGRITVSITAATLAQDDKDHSHIAQITQALESAIYSLRRAALLTPEEGDWKDFKDAADTPGESALNALLQIEAGMPAGGDLLTQSYTLTFTVCVF